METVYTNTTNVPIDEATAGALLAVFGGFLMLAIVFVLLVYIYTAICLMKIAKKTGTANAWFAWIPILNIILLIQCAQKPLWWIILFFIPFVNIIMVVLVWMAVAKNLGKPDWLGILMIIPFVNLILYGYLAFSKSELPAPTVPPTAPANPVQ